MITFEFRASYQDTVRYAVLGHSNATEISVYGANVHMLAYMERTHNHCGDPTSFARNVLSRQGGATFCSNGTMLHWTPDLYLAFVEWLIAKYEAAKIKWAGICERYGWGAEEMAQFGPMAIIPVPMYFDQTNRTHLVEGWFIESQSRAA